MPLKPWLAARALVVCALCCSACSSESKPQREALSTATAASVPPAVAYGGTGDSVSPTTEVEADDSATTGTTSNDCGIPGSGSDFYLTQDRCVRCHGSDALGVAGAGPEVRNPAPDYARWIIRAGREGHSEFEEGMPAFDSCSLSDAQLDDVLQFLSGFGKASDGQGLYADFCAGCHGTDARGGVTEVDLDAHLDDIPSVSMTGHMTDSFESRSEYMPVMTDRLTSEELALIRQYLRDELGLQG